jgi:hypothetical protein
MGDRPYAEWQREAWEYYDAIGEVKYAFSLLAAVMSRVRLYSGLILDPDAPPSSISTLQRRKANQTALEQEKDVSDALSPPVEITQEVIDAVDDVIRDLGSGHGGIPGLLRTYCINMSVPGECYLIRHQNRWSIRSTEEVQLRKVDGKAVLKRMRSSNSASSVMGSAGEETLPKNAFIGRIWRPHPRFTGEPDSSMLALREMCDELLTLQRMIRAIARSRMNAGLLFVPDGISASSSSQTESMADAELEVDPFEQELMLALTAPVSDEANASTVVPMLARGPVELGKDIRYMSFSRDSDRGLIERADRTLDRILQGIDVPKDVVTGLANVKYSNAVQIDEALYKSHVEPLALLLCDALTTMYLRPALASRFPEMDESVLAKIAIWYDPTEVVTKPDPAQAASEGYDRYALSGDAWRRAHGFADTDAPDEDELARRVALERATVPPEIAASLIRSTLPEVFNKAQAENVEALPVPFPDSAAEMLGIPTGDERRTGPTGPSRPAKPRRTAETQTLFEDSETGNE